ncbi:MAG: ABC transporter permease [Anaerolineaceae bacterium]
MAQSQDSVILPGITTAVVPRSAGRLKKLARTAKRNKLGTVGVVMVLFVMSVAAVGPLIQRYGDNEAFQTANPKFNPTANPLDIAQDASLSTPFILDRFEPPNSTHWLGTDQFGRDIYARVIVGTRLAVIIGIGASLIAVFFGTSIGIISGYFGGKIDLVIQRFVDALQAFPGLVLLLLIVQVVEEPPLWLFVVALGLLGWATSVRIVRSAVLALSQTTFVEAARAFGATDTRIMARHILPNVMGPILIVFSISIGAYILAEASLSFLGVGPADKTTWGKMVNAGRQAVDLHPWEALFAGSAITLTVLGFNLAGDAIRDELDPRLRGR